MTVNQIENDRSVISLTVYNMIKILVSYQCIPKGFIESLGSPHSLQVDWFFKFGNIGKSECHLSDNYKVNDTFKPSLSEYINVFMKHKKLCFNKFKFANW